MIKPFRKYKTTVDWIDDNRVLMSCDTVLNLFDVAEWSSCDNKAFGFNDNYERSCITFHNNNMYKIRVPFEKIDTIMTQFLEDVKLLDERSMFEPKKKSMPTSINLKYGVYTSFN